VGQIRNSQIINNDLTGASINRNFRFFDEREIPISAGEIRFWQGVFWRVISDITITETGGSIPKEGDMTYSPDSQPIYWQKIPNYGVDRIVFESMDIPGYNITTNILNGDCIQPMASRMHNNWEVYGENLLFDVTDEGGNSWYGLTFPTITDYITWHNSQTFISMVHVEIYGLLNSKKNNYHKIYGRNEGLSIIKGCDINGRSNYHKNICLFQSNWDERSTFAMDILNRLTGTTPSSSTDAQRCIHSPGNQSIYTLYQTLNTPNTIHFNGGLNSNKRCYNPSTLGFNSINSGDVFLPMLGGNGFYAITQNTGGWSFIGVQNLVDNRYIDSVSLVKVYGFQRNDGCVIAIVKPVGQDSWRISWKEPVNNKKIIIGFYNRDDKMILKDVTSLVDSFSNGGTSFLIPKSVLSAGNKSSTNYNLSKMTVRNMEIFISDGDGFISKVPHSIDWILKANGAKAYLLLNNNHSYN